MAATRMADVQEVNAAEAVSGRYCVVDVRSRAEFAEGHVPGAVNLPLLEDPERAEVGSAYHAEGPGQARILAMGLSSRRLPRYLRHLATLASRCGPLAVMCWRGGDRSGNVARLLGLIDVEAWRVAGGYKAYRRWVLDGLQSWRPPGRVVTLYGYTGSGKTALVREMRHRIEDRIREGEDPGALPSVVDLEGLALHRGSLLGGLNQPGRRTQKQFDGLLWEELRTARGAYLVLEGESAKIGHIFLPERVGEAIRGGVPVEVGMPPELRAERILRDYVPGSWAEDARRDFLAGLERIGSRVPADVVATVREHFVAGRYREAVTDLLVEYYDPLYYRSCVKGKHFAYTFEAEGDPRKDAPRLLEALGSTLEERTRTNPPG